MMKGLLIGVLILVLVHQAHSRAGPAARPPRIVAHRGTPCRIPEETIAGYAAAIEAGADFIEMDVVSTKDGHLILRHDLTLDDSTNIKDLAHFQDRFSTKRIPAEDGTSKNVTGFFISDFTMEEISSLKARQVFSFRDHSLDDTLEVNTLEQVLQFATQNGHSAGVYIETKEAFFHDSLGLSLESKLIDALIESKFAGPIFLQSFSFNSLKKLVELARDRGLDLEGVTWLLECSNSIKSIPRFEEFVSIGGTAVGPDKCILLPVEDTKECGKPRAPGDCYQKSGQCSGRLTSVGKDESSRFVEAARKYDLEIHPWTLRNEETFAPLDFSADPFQEYDALLEAGATGFFVDCPETAVRWRSTIVTSSS